MFINQNETLNEHHSTIEEMASRPYFSRFRLGANRWYWVVEELMDEPIATGIAERQVGSVSITQNGLAEDHWKKQRALQRSQAVSNGATASQLEFVYQCLLDYSDYNGSPSDSLIKHRIVKRTKKRIYVEKKPYRDNVELTGAWWEWIESTFVLDRQQFESTGKARRFPIKWWDGAFYSSPEVYFSERKQNARPECFKILDVDSTATEKEIKSAYRGLARIVHPDTGGNPEEFKRVRKAYDEALVIVRQGLKI
jgi:hypothetical protein